MDDVLFAKAIAEQKGGRIDNAIKLFSSLLYQNPKYEIFKFKNHERQSTISL